VWRVQGGMGWPGQERASTQGPACGGHMRRRHMVLASSAASSWVSSSRGVCAGARGPGLVPPAPSRRRLTGSWPAGSWDRLGSMPVDADAFVPNCMCRGRGLGASLLPRVWGTSATCTCMVWTGQKWTCSGRASMRTTQGFLGAWPAPEHWSRRLRWGFLASSAALECRPPRHQSRRHAQAAIERPTASSHRLHRQVPNAQFQ